MKKFYSFLIASCLVFSFIPSFGQAIWTGDTDSDWATASNWSPTNLPTANEDVTIDPTNYTGAAASPTISSNYGTVLGTLTVRNNGVLNIQANLTGDNTPPTEILIQTGGIINHSAGTVSDFDDLKINGGTLNISGTASMIMRDDALFEGPNGTINITGGSLTTGNIGDGLLDINNQTGIVINITGGSMTTGELVDNEPDTEIIANGGTISIAGNNVLTVLNGQTLNVIDGEDITDDVIINIGGAVTSSASANFTVRGNVINNGTFTAGASSTINLDGGATQTISGNSTYTAHSLVIGGSVSTALSLQTDIELSGGFFINVGNGSSMDATNSTVTFNGSSAQLIASAATFYNLVLDNSSGLSIFGGSSTITNNLTLTDGILTTNTHNVSVCNGTASAMITGGSTTSFINGNLVRCTDAAAYYDFPVGVGTDYKRAGMTPDAAAEATYTVYAASGGSNPENLGAGINNVSTIEHWDIDGSADATVRLYWNSEAASGISDVDEVFIGHYTGGQWEAVAVSANVGSYVESAASISSWSPFTFASNSSSENVLPVTWLNFEASSVDGSVELNWSTAAELNNLGFHIEKSINGINWQEVGFVSGNGTVNEVSNYSFRDALQPMKYYRLKQEDTDGTIDYSKVVEVYGETDRDIFLMQQNSRLSLFLNNQPKSEGEVKIYNLQGALLWHQALVFEEGNNRIGYSLSGSGQMLIIYMRMGGEARSFKIFD